MIGSPPKIDNAPGLTWKPRKHCWEARWQARRDLIARGWSPKSVRIWSGAEEPTEMERSMIAFQCTDLQTQMLTWGRGGINMPGAMDGTLSGLIQCYRSDADSSYQKLRYRSRLHYDVLCNKLDRERGTEKLSDLKARTFLRWHEDWTKNGARLTMGHHYIAMLRILANFGSTILEDAESSRIAGLLHGMRFPMARPREERLTAEQANMIRNAAHENKRPSIALAQAFQFECILRQKDVIGEWVPISEPGPVTDVLAGNSKWLRGIRWEEIDANLVLRHVTSKRQKMIEVPLARAPMIVDEIGRQFPGSVVEIEALVDGILQKQAVVDRAKLPANGPIVVSEYSRIPWENREFYRQWRLLADKCEIPKTVRNMDSRAGAISEATDAGAELEHVRHAATHGDISMTQRYSRGAADKIAGVLDKRVAHRQNKTGK